MDNSHVEEDIKTIAQFPTRLVEILGRATDKSYSTAYREGGWTLSQVVHHVADSHMVAYQRMKRAATDQQVLVYGYKEALWADLADVTTDIEDSLQIIHGLHSRWYRWLSSLTEVELAKSYYHLDDGSSVTLSQAIATYAWHSTHHLGHVRLIVDGPTW